MPTHTMTKHTATPSHALPKLKPLVASLFTWVQRPGTLALTLGAMPALALAAMPTGGKVVAGAATISNPDGNHTIINQTSDKAVLNWQSFSIGEGGYVQFVQRDANSVALNRVVGSDPSAILGNLSANGQIFLVNQNGIFFGHSAKVDVAGIVATTLDIKDEDFMRGDFRFSRGANAPARATVINEGALNANGGYVVLAGDYAANKGVVQAQLGTVLLASGDSLTLQMAGSSLINYQVDKATVAHLAGVDNSGQILANGGRVIMTADVAQDLASTVVNNSGLIQAQSAVEKNGAIYFEGNGGNVANSGTLDASAQAGANGGHVEIRASGDIAHEAGSKIDVSGATTGVSDGGSVMTWADGSNRYKEGASIAARGGAQGGNGGDVELSGNHVVNRSIVDLSAANGQLGTLTLDPLAITVANGAGTNTEDGATIYEQNLEAQLKVGNVSLLATGQDASITVGAMSDGVLDGSNNGSGGSLSLRAEGSGNPAVRFADKTNTIKVDKAISISTGDLEAPASGTIDVGHLQAGTGIALDSGSIKAASLSVQKTIATPGDTSYAINARATNGGITIDGDVKLDVTNTAAGALSTTVSLRADNGDVNVGGAVTSNATGLGYYNYNWTTAGNDATTYYGEQPWSMVSQADHPILATLNIQASGSVRASEVNVLATDKNIAFDTTPGGYWQTATATQHNFWRATGAKAVGTVNAGADVSIAGKTSVKADGYATSSYGETESWRAMVSNFNYTSGSQTVITTRPNGQGGTTETSTTNNYNNVKGSVKGAGSQRYIWSFGPYSTIHGSTVYNSSNVSTNTDSASGSDTAAMGYSGVAGMSANLNVNAGGSVAMKGLDVRSTNRSGTGSGSYTDGFWGRQDTAANISGTDSSFTSANAEIDYKDVFQTSYSAATSTATANITAGDNASVTIGEHSDVVAEHTLIDAATNSLAGATMTITAGTNGGATGTGLVSIAGGINVNGASGNDVSLTVRNYDGNVELNGADSTITNTYVGADARAQVQADNGRIDAEGIAVSGGHAAYLDLTASAGMTLAGTASTLVTSGGSNGAAAIRISAGGDVSAQDIRATSNNGQQTGNGFNAWTIDGGTASVSLQSSGGDVALHGDVRAEGYESATVSVAANGAGARLSTDAGTSVDASTNAPRYDSGDWYQYTQPTYVASTNLQADAGIDLGGDVGASLAGRNGEAYVGITTTGGKDAAIIQAAGTTIGADGARATVNIAAGAQGPNSSNGAAVDLQGRVSAQAGSDAAMVTVSAAGGTVHDFAANSSANAASVTFNAVDADGKLTIDGQGNIGGNFENVAGAALNVYGSGAVDAASSRISVTNFSGNANAGARATLNANHGDLQLGELSVSGTVSAVIGAHASGALDSRGPVSAMANGYNGYSGISLDTTAGAITVADGGAVAASAYSNGSANLSLSSGAGLALGDDISAYTFGEGGARVTATTGASGAIDQDAGTRIFASGGSADVSLTTGTFDLQGSVQASASNLPANLSINGTSGSIGDFGASSAASAASATVNATGGDLTLTGNGNVNGAVSANLNATASGKLEVRGQLDTVQSGVFGNAQTSLVSSGGSLLVGADATVATRSNGMMANATLNLTGASGMTVEGDLAATASGSATVNLVTTGGTGAAIVQGADSAITANGYNATIGVKAGNGAPNAANAAALDLAGALHASGNAAGADVGITGAGGKVHSAIAQSGNGAASVGIAAVGNGASLVVDGDVTATANVNSLDGSQLTISSSGALDTDAAKLAAVNLGGAAKAQLNATGGDIAAGDLSVRGTHATIGATASGLLGVNGELLAVANGSGGQAQITLDSSSAATVATGASVGATSSGAEGAAIVGLSGVTGVTVDGAIDATANGNGGDASINLFAAQGDIALNAGLSAAASDVAGIGILAGSGDIAANADIASIGGNAGTMSLRALDGSLTQAAGATLHAGARNGTAQVDLNSSGALRIDGDILAAATTDGNATGQHSGGASVNIGTTGGAQSSITQDAGSTVSAIGLSANIAIAAGTSFPAADIANSAAFQLDGSLRAIDALGGARLDIAGASGSVHDFTVDATNAPANVVIAAVRGDLVLDGTANVNGQTGGASLRVEATGALDTSAATVTVTNGGMDAADYAEASFDAYGGNAKLGETTVLAVGGAASLYASSTGAMSLPHNLSAASVLNTGNVNLSTTGGADATITQAAGSTILARGASEAAVRISAGSSKAGARALFTLDGDIQAAATNGLASIDIDGAGGSVHDFSAESTRASAQVNIAGVDSGAAVVLNGTGSVSANADEVEGAWLNVSSEGTLDTSAATLSADNAFAGENGGARAHLHASGNAVLGAASVSGARVAALDASAGGNLRADGALASSAASVAGTASAALSANGQAIVGATGSLTANAVNPIGNAAVNVSGDHGVGIQGSLAANAANQATINVLAAGGDIALDGAVGAISARNATVNVTALDGKLAQSAGGTVHAGGGNGTGQVSLTSRGAMTIDGDVSAAATADGSVNAQHTGSALVNLTTTGGASASITQGAHSTIEAVGRAAYLTVKAGDSDMGRDSSATAAFDLGGTLRAIDAIGGSSLVIGGASGRVHDFTVTAQNAPASAVITAFNGNVVLDGSGNVVANTSSSAGASLRIDASGSIDTTAAQIGIANLSGDDGASARAELYAQGGAKLGDLSVSANAAAKLTAMAGSDLDVSGRLSAAGTAAYGQAEIDLTATNVVTVGSTGVVNVTGGSTMGSAGLSLDGSHGVNVAGSLNAYANEAAIGLQASAGNIVLDGALAAQGGDRASIEALAGGTLAQSGASRIHSGATNGVAEAYLSSTGAMTIAGRVSAAATQDGSVDGAHSGAALVGLSTTGGAGATVTQAAGSTIEAVGLAARLGIAAGSGSPVENADKAAAFKLDGTLRAIDDIGGSTLEIAGASGSVHDFTVAAANSNAKASITAVGGNLAFNGKGEVTGNAERTTGASLLVKAAGNVDTTAATLTVSNANASRETGAAAVLQAGGNLAFGPVSVTGANAALNAGAAGKLDVLNTLAASGTTSAGIQLLGGQGVTLGAALNASADQAYIAVTAASGNVALNSAVTALGGDRASVAVQALDGSLTQAAGTTITAGATSGVAEVDLSSSGALAINGKILAAATADGTADGAHTGAALIGITTTGGAASGISQSQASSIEAVGRAARLAINAGSAHFGDDAGADVTKAAAFKLDGTLRAIDAIGGSSLQIAGASGSVHDFTVAAADATAHADIAAVNGDLVLSGTGSVSGNANALDGASLKLSASGSLDTTGTTLKVVNVNSGDEAGAQAVLLASTGAAKLGVAKVTAQGGGTAAFEATAGTTLVATAKLDAENLGLGTAAGNALVKLNTTGKTGMTSTVTQDGGATITAATRGNAGNATVDIQAGNCCNSAVTLNDTVKAVVDGGTGSATIAARGATVTVKDLTANVLSAGTGNSMVSLAAPTEVKLTGAIDSQAAQATARAQVQLVSDKLTDGASFKLSKGNGHVQLSAFNTGKIIGVHSDRDFDETADVNFNLPTLKKFMTQGAELTFGGEFDRSAWIDPVTGEVCLPGMEAWASQLQHSGAIHVAGNGRLNLGDVKMVFDTTGITTYHDPKLAAWSVPTGRVATLVVPPSNVDRYLDRTDNTVQNMNKVVQDTTATTRSSGAAEAGQPAPRGTQIGGKLFMDGNGVNMARNDAAEGSQADAQGPESKSRNNGDSTEQ